MSLDTKGKYVYCDGDNCASAAPLPVALRPTMKQGGRSADTITGWLFVQRGGQWRHFCPTCAASHLQGFLVSGAGHSTAVNYAGAAPHKEWAVG